MADLRYTTVVGQFQTELLDLFTADPQAPTVLEALAKPLKAITGTSTFREYVTPLRKGIASTLSADRALTSGNLFTTNPSYNGAITSGAHTNGYIDHTIEDTWRDAFDIDLTGGVDAQFNSPSEQASRAKTQFDQSFTQYKDDQIAALALESNTWIVATAAKGTLDAAITAGDTTFDVQTGEVASMGIAAGSIVKIGATRSWGSKSGEQEYLDVALVKSVSTDTVTIETVAANLPTSMSMFGDTFVNGLVLSLRAHADDTLVVVDAPTALTTTNIDDEILEIRTLAKRAYIFGRKLTLYVTPEVYALMQGVSASGVFAPMAANDFLGKKVLEEGDFAMMRGMKVTSSANALGRVGGVSDAALAKPIHYIWAFEENATFGYGMRASYSDTQDVQGSPVLKRYLAYKICGFTMLYAGSQKSFLKPVTV